MKTVADITRLHAEERPDKVALVFQGRETTYATLDRRANMVANQLIADGTSPDARIALLAKNTDVFYELWFGAMKARAVLVPVNFRLAPPEVAFVVNDARAEILFVDAEHADLVAGIEDRLETVRRIIHLDGPRGTWADYAAWRDDGGDEEPGVPVMAADVSIQMYTSGTTGQPKGAQLTHGNITALLPRGSSLWAPWTDDDVNLVCMPLYHIAGSEWGLLGLYNGARNIIMPDVDPGEILRFIREERVTQVLFVPAVILFLLQTPGCEETDFSSVKQIIYGASPIPFEVLARAVKVMKCDFAQLYGLTETTGGITYLPPEDHDPAGNERMKSCGKPMTGVEIRIVDEDGNELPPRQVGEIVCRSDQIMKGYWNLPEATRRAIREDWFYTGDAGYLDEDGYLYIYDRIKDMILSGGENVYPAEVESALFRHPAVADAAVIGVPDEKWGEAVKAVIVKAPGTDVTADELIAYAREQIAGYKVPKSIDFVDQIPRNPSGKILKRELREPYWHGRGRQVN